MSAFYVGQRVRIMSCPNPRMAHWVGTEDRVTGFSDVHPGGVFLAIANTSCYGGRCSWAPHRLEPIVDDGRKVVSWSDCLWQPEGIAA